MKIFRVRAFLRTGRFFLGYSSAISLLSCLLQAEIFLTINGNSDQDNRQKDADRNPSDERRSPHAQLFGRLRQVGSRGTNHSRFLPHVLRRSPPVGGGPCKERTPLPRISSPEDRVHLRPALCSGPHVVASQYSFHLVPGSQRSWQTSKSFSLPYSA